MDMPHLFHRILVPTDFSEAASAAIAQAVHLAKTFGASITVVHVVPPVTGVPGFSPAPETFMAAWQPDGNAAEVEQKLLAAAEHHLRDAIGAYRGEGLDMSYKSLLGAPFMEVIHAVQEEGFDLVVTGTRGRSAFSRLLVGSTAAKLVRKCPCPVWIVNPDTRASLNAVLAPIDYSDVSHESLRFAAGLASRFQAELHVLHVFSTAHSYFLDLLPDDEFDISPELHRHELVAELQRFVKDSGVGIEPVLHVEWGEVVPRILATADQVDAGLIVMGTLGRAGVAGLLIGNTAEKVMHHSHRPLLAVKPIGYVSPVAARFAAVET